MKAKFLFFVLALGSLGACNNPDSPATETIPATPLALAVIDSPAPRTNLPYAAGLTLEEMKDDSVFADGSIPTTWEVAGIQDVNAFKIFLKQIQRLVLANEKEALALHVKYPLNKTIKTQEDFIKNYDRLITKDIKISIANINFSQVFRNSKGVMTEGGSMWFGSEGDSLKIIAINN